VVGCGGGGGGGGKCVQTRPREVCTSQELHFAAPKLFRTRPLSRGKFVVRYMRFTTKTNMK
jgi:hypothetical protein